MDRDEPTRSRPTAWLWALAAGNALLHLAVVARYGWFRDELYYLACGRRLDWGYVDHPPFVALVARLATALGGESLLAVRLPAILAGSLVVLVAGLLARDLGGGSLAQVLAGLCVIVAPVYLFSFHILSMNSFEVLFWTLGAWVLVRILEGGDPRLWLLFGLIAGVGLQNKHSMAFFGAGVVVGLLLTPARRHLATPWSWLGGLVAALLFLPNLLWEVRHGWPTLEFAANAQAEKNVALSPVAFLAEQALQMHPHTLPFWLTGLVALLAAARYRRLRPLGWAYLAVLGILLAQTAKAYYLMPVYPYLFAAGAVPIADLAARRRWRWLPAALLAFLVLGGALTAPLTLPLLPEETFLRYSAALGVQPSAGERHRLGVLPQHFADMHGWEELTATVARVWRSLPPEERERCAIFGQNYGEAGAIDLLGDRWGLPDALSAHNNYYLWGPRGATGECLVVLGDDAESLREIFAEVEPAATFTCHYCMPYEEMTIHVCRRPRLPLAEAWPRIKSYG